MANVAAGVPHPARARRQAAPDAGSPTCSTRACRCESAPSCSTSAAPYIDVWKFGWGTAYLDPGLPEKLDLLAEHGVLACTGGTLLEIAWPQGVVDEYLDWAAAVGFPCVEVSCGVVAR